MRLRFPIAPLSLLLALAALSSTIPASDVTVQFTTLPDRVRVDIEGQLFTEYLFRMAARPFLYPVVLADGTRMTRDFPLLETPGEDRDHPHQRSLWFAHGRVNGIDFWNEALPAARRRRAPSFTQHCSRPRVAAWD